MGYVHRCELSPSDDSLTDHYSKKASAFAPCLALFWDWSSISQNHPKCREYLITLSATKKERRRQEINARGWIIHPFSKIRFYWETTMMFVYFISFFSIPLMICFVVLDYDLIADLDNINLIVYSLCWIDIMINCVTGIYSSMNNEFCLDQKMILKKYMTGYFLVDVFTSLPYDHISYAWRTGPLKNTSPIVITLNLIPLLKLLRYFTFSSYVRQTFLYFHTEDISTQLGLTILLYVYVVHWFTCFCSAGSVLMWIVDDDDVIGINNRTKHREAFLFQKHQGIPQRYQTALFVVIENLTATGYGGQIPESDTHIAVCNMLMLLGRLFESYIIIMLMQIVADRKASESKYEQIVNQLSAYSMQKQLPPYIKKRLLAYYHHRFRNSYFREKRILFSLSNSLKEEVTLHSCRRLVENVEIFQDLPKHILTLIVTNLKPELYLRQDMIIKAGTQGDCMFFLSSGTVAILTPTGKEVCFLEDGAHFGEVALLVQDQRRVASVVAAEVCEVYRLERKDFRKCIAVHSDLYAKVERVATERMQRTAAIEEQHKRYALYSRPSFQQRHKLARAASSNSND